MTGEAAGWSHSYPWGRKSPKKRIEELSRRRLEILSRERRFKDRVTEMLIDFRRKIEAIDADLETARRCECDRVRRMTKELAYRLLEPDIDVLGRIEQDDGDEALFNEVQSICREVAGAEDRRGGILPMIEVTQEGGTDGDIDALPEAEPLVVASDLIQCKEGQNDGQIPSDEIE